MRERKKGEKIGRQETQEKKEHDSESGEFSGRNRTHIASPPSRKVETARRSLLSLSLSLCSRVAISISNYPIPGVSDTGVYATPITIWARKPLWYFYFHFFVFSALSESFVRSANKARFESYTNNFSVVR